MNFDLPSFLIGIAVGAIAGCVIAFYLLKRYMQKKAQEITKLMKKEEIRQLASAFGHNLSEQQLNMMMASMERAVEQSKTKNKKNK